MSLSRRQLLTHSAGAAAMLGYPALARAARSFGGSGARPLKVILDTDIGGDIDDAYALAILGSLLNVEILGVVTAFGETEKRARIAAKLLRIMGKSQVPVYPGLAAPGGPGRQYEWAKEFTSGSIQKGDPIAFMKNQIERYPGEVTLIGIGPLTNLAALFARYPSASKKVKQVVLMAGSFYVGYNNMPPIEPESNVVSDPKAAQVVFQSGVPLTVAGLEVTTMMHLEEERQKRLFAHGTPLTDALAALTILWGGHVPVLYDPFAVAYAAGKIFCDYEEQRVVVDDRGFTRIESGSKNATILVHPQKEAFLDWVLQVLVG